MLPGEETIRPPAMEANLHCLYIHNRVIIYHCLCHCHHASIGIIYVYQDPYLLLGPFLYEIVDSNFAAIFHHVYSDTEMEEVKLAARGKMRPATLTHDGKKLFYERNCKHVSMNEAEVPALAESSRRIRLATGLEANEDMYSSENYQVKIVITIALKKSARCSKLVLFR